MGGLGDENIRTLPKMSRQELSESLGFDLSGPFGPVSYTHLRKMSVFIIAEAGVNHNGSLELAKKLALAAKECGADAVKYQTAVPELVVSRFAPAPVCTF